MVDKGVSRCIGLLAGSLPQQTVKACNWTIAGAAGCTAVAGAGSQGWVTLPAPPAQPQAVGSPDVSSMWTLPAPPAGSPSPFVGTGSYAGQVRVLVDTNRWSSPNPAALTTWANLLTVAYDAP